MRSLKRRSKCSGNPSSARCQGIAWDHRDCCQFVGHHARILFANETDAAASMHDRALGYIKQVLEPVVEFKKAWNFHIMADVGGEASVRLWSSLIASSRPLRVSSHREYFRDHPYDQRWHNSVLNWVGPGAFTKMPRETRASRARILHYAASSRLRRKLRPVHRAPYAHPRRR